MLVKLNDKSKRYYPLIVDILVIGGLWQLSTLWLPQIVAPPLGAIGRAFVAIFTNHTDLINLLTTAARIGIGVCLGFVGGALIGLLIGESKATRRYLEPVLFVVQGIPGLSWVVFAVIWFANPETRIAFVLIVITLPAFALYIKGAVDGIDVELIEMAKAVRATRWQIVKTIIIPGIMPEVISAWTVNLGNAVRVAVVAELIGSTVGVGFQLLQAQSVFNMAGAIAWTLSLVLILLIYQMCVSSVGAYVLRWRPRSERTK